MGIYFYIYKHNGGMLLAEPVCHNMKFEVLGLDGTVHDHIVFSAWLFPTRPALRSFASGRDVECNGNKSRAGSISNNGIYVGLIVSICSVE